MSSTLSFREALSTGWQLTKSRYPLLLAYLGSLFLLGTARYFIEKPITSTGGRVVVGIIFLLINWYLTFNALGVSIKLVDGKDAGYVDFWLPQKNYWFYVVGTILYGLLTGVGTILLIVPGVIFGLMFMFYGYVVFDKGLGPIEALKESRRLTAGAKWDLFLFSLLSVGLNLLGLLAVVVGVLATACVTFIALAHLYRQRTRALEESPAA